MTQAIPPRTSAPDFTLPTSPGATLSLHELKGRPVVLAFYPADWSPVCGDQMALYQAALPEFQRYGAQPVGISVDGVWCHRAFAQHNRIEFPLLSDFMPTSDRPHTVGSYANRDVTTEKTF